MRGLLLVVLLAAAASAATLYNEESEDSQALIVPEGEEMAVDNEEYELPQLPIGIALRRNLNIGFVGHGDRIIERRIVKAHACAGQIVAREEIFGNGMRITAIQVFGEPWGTTQQAHPFITGGGVGQSFVRIRIESKRGHGFQYTIQVYGR